MGIKSRLWGGKKLLAYVFFISTALLAIPADADDETGVEQDDAPLAKSKVDEISEVDPYENFNRSMFSFNDRLDAYVAKPISDAYLWVSPNFFKTGISNFFSNLKDINVVLNDHMQGKFEQGAEDTGRFLTNSTLGLLGLFDVATEIGLKKHDEDFGQTLAVWGIPQGAYLVLPILGPTTARGVPGSVFDVAANPTTYIGMPVQLVSMLNTRANAEGALKFIDEAAIDPYVFTREAYLQYQQNLITDGKTSSNVNVMPLEDDVAADVDAAMAEGGGKKPAADVGLGNADGSLDRALQALDKANASLEASSEKLDKLKKKRFKRHARPKT